MEVGAPTIKSVTPDTARLEGGQQVTITGTNFAPESKLTLGDAEVTNYAVVSSTEITLTVPPQRAPGGRTLTVLTRGGAGQARFDIVSPSLSELAPGEITTVYGGSPFLGDGGAARSARFLLARGIGLSADGTLVVADQDAASVRAIAAATGIVTSMVGSGIAGFGGDGGLAPAARLNAPTALAFDASQNLYIADSYNNRIRRVDAVSGAVTTVAGTGADVSTGDGGPAIEAGLYYPTSLRIDDRGDVLIAENGGDRIRMIDGATGIIRTIAGTDGGIGYSGDGGPAADARLAGPSDLAFAPNGDLYIADTLNDRIRRISMTSGRIDTVAGNDVHGYGGDGGLATSASLDFPSGVGFDPFGNLLIADSGNARVRRVDGASGVITTIVGTGEHRPDSREGIPGTSSTLSSPSSLVSDAHGDVFIADGALIRRFDSATGTVSTAAGVVLNAGFENEPGQPVGIAAASGPLNVETADGRLLSVDPQRGTAAVIFAGAETYGQIAVGADGNLLVCESNNGEVLRVDRRTGKSTSLAGTGVVGFSGDGGPAKDAELSFAYSVTVDLDGNVIIADSGNYRIRLVDHRTGAIHTIAGTGDDGFGGNGGLAADAQFGSVHGVLASRDGHLLIADTVNNQVRRIELATGRIDAFAGDGSQSLSGDGQPGISVGVANPTSVAEDGEGNVYIAETGRHRVRRVDARTGLISTIVGDGTNGYGGDGGPAASAHLNSPGQLAIDAEGDIFIADVDNFAVRVIRAAAAPARSQR